MHSRQTRRGRKRPRRGNITLELLIALPILLFFVLFVVVLSLLEANKQRVVAASAQGSRVAAQGGDEEDVKQAVRQSLGSNNLRRHAKIDVELGRRTGDAVLVKVTVPAKRAVPDLLRFLGFSIQGQNLVAQSVQRKE